MSVYLEISTPKSRRAVSITEDRATIGRASTNQVAIDEDTRLSRLHAVLERFESGWCIRDLGSRNGVFVNGQRVADTRPLRSGDELHMGDTAIIFRADEPVTRTGTTETTPGRPELTRRERDVLLALCRPVLTGDVFTEPASIRRVAEELVVSEAAVKQHLGRLYDKFGLHVPEERRRVRLANEAVHRGAITLGDLKQAPKRT
jgi:pSer/pThr/pTyr-binding forkhead associated (FHA) protein